jgi:hypothetical protein
VPLDERLAFIRAVAQLRWADRPATVTADRMPCEIRAAGVADREAIAAAVEMLPKGPVRIAVIDVTENRPQVRDYLLTLDALPSRAMASSTSSSRVRRSRARERDRRCTERCSPW